jgi:hypothetical protein
MAFPTESNWRQAAAFNTAYSSIADCVYIAIAVFSRRHRTPFVILRHQINSTWHLMPFSEYRQAPADHPCMPSTICFFGNYAEFQEICLSFPLDLFNISKEGRSLTHDSAPDAEVPGTTYEGPIDPDEAEPETDAEVEAAVAEALKALDDAKKAIDQDIDPDDKPEDRGPDLGPAPSGDGSDPKTLNPENS